MNLIPDAREASAPLKHAPIAADRVLNWIEKIASVIAPPRDRLTLFVCLHRLFTASSASTHAYARNVVNWGMRTQPIRSDLCAKTAAPNSALRPKCTIERLVGQPRPQAGLMLAFSLVFLT